MRQLAKRRDNGGHRSAKFRRIFIREKSVKGRDVVSLSDFVSIVAFQTRRVRNLSPHICYLARLESHPPVHMQPSPLKPVLGRRPKHAITRPHLLFTSRANKGQTVRGS